MLLPKQHDIQQIHQGEENVQEVGIHTGSSLDACQPYTFSLWRDCRDGSSCGRPIAGRHLHAYQELNPLDL
jgi:hypothetical protein